MKNLLAISVVLMISLAGCAHQEQQATTAETFRVLSYNIHHGEGTDGKLDIARIAGIVEQNHADLVAIQEVDVKTQRVPIDEPAELARLTHMHVMFGKAINLQGGQYGQVILSRFPISNPHIYKLPSKPDKEQRIALSVTISPGDGHPDFRFVTTHLDHQANADRVEQATELMAVLMVKPAMPTILAGDFNSFPDSEPMAKVFEHFTDSGGKPAAPTVPSDRPRHKIDYVLISKDSGWSASGSRVLEEPTASDHRPVMVNIGG